MEGTRGGWRRGVPRRGQRGRRRPVAVRRLDLYDERGDPVGQRGLERVRERGGLRTADRDLGRAVPGRNVGERVGYVLDEGVGRANSLLQVDGLHLEATLPPVRLGVQSSDQGATAQDGEDEIPPAPPVRGRVTLELVVEPEHLARSGAIPDQRVEGRKNSR